MTELETLVDSVADGEALETATVITGVGILIHPVNTAFSKLLPKLQLAMDSTSLGALKTCPRLYELSIIEGYASPYQAVHLEFGIMFHSATETYDKARASGSDHEAAMILAIRRAINDTWNEKLKRPWMSDEPTKTRNTLLRSLVWYLDHYKDDRMKTLVQDGVPAVELSFRFGSGIKSETTGEEFVLCGHLDKAVEWNTGIYILDKKTTKYELDDTYFKQFIPDNQMSIYNIAGMVVLDREISGLIIDACQMLVNGTRFRRQPVTRTPEQLEEWLTDLKLWLHMAETFARANHWPMNEKSCGYGRRQCQFRPVCSADASVRTDMLNSLYVRRTWDPLQPR